MTAQGLFTPRQRLIHLSLVLAWLGVNLAFWGWWLNPIHRGNTILFFGL